MNLRDLRQGVDLGNASWGFCTNVDREQPLDNAIAAVAVRAVEALHAAILYTA